MDPETPKPTAPRRPRLRRALAVAAGVAMVPALYAVANAATDRGGDSSSTVSAASRSADDRGTETEVEHGVVVEKPHGGATTPSVPEVTSPTVPQATTPSTPEVTTPTTPEFEDEHPVPEPGDDNGNVGNGGGAVTPVPTGTQAFSSVGGSIVVSVNGSSISLASSSPAAGFGAEVHDNGPTRVEVRFFSDGTEWRIRVELGSGGLTSDVTQHG
jgi:hypothetical protein